MSKRWILMIVLTVFIIVVIKTVNTIDKDKTGAIESEISIEKIDSDGVKTKKVAADDESIESETFINLIEGDSGEEELITISTRLDVPEKRGTKAGFQEFMLEYAYTQNYTRNGVNYGYADKTYENGIDLIDSAARISGLGTNGYIMWVLKNTFGICDQAFKIPISIYKKSSKVLPKDLQVGDLGFYSESEDDSNFCGICIGLEDGEPVFSLMDGTWSENFPFGTNRLCYLQSGKNEFLETSPPVKFRLFCRPDLPWAAGEEINLKGLVQHGQDKQNY